MAGRLGSPRSVASRSFTPLNLHVAAVLLFLVFDIVLGTRLLLAWHRSSSDQTAQYNADLASFGRLQTNAAKLRNLPAELEQSEQGAEHFFSARIEPSDSAMISDLGALATRDRVRLSRAGYAPQAALPGIVEMRIEANVAGQYPDIMHFINDVERDKEHAFFIIRSVVLTGQQGGLVNLRLRIDTYMRADAGGVLLQKQDTEQETQ